MARDWHEWHQAYDQPGSPLSIRLAHVQQCVRNALDAAPTGPISVISMCAGEGRDLLGVFVDHPRAGDVYGRLVELDPGLAETARAAAPPKIDVLVADAGLSNAYEGAVPADVVLVCGVFGNITDADIANLVEQLPMLCAPGATVIWTRHRRPPDRTPETRALFAKHGFDETAWITPDDTLFSVAAERFTGNPAPFRPHVRLFEFVGYDTLTETCQQCGFSYDMPRVEVVPWLRADTVAFVERFRHVDPALVRVRAEPDVWSPLEYACHVRDVLRVQHARVEQAQHEHEPTFTPMRREERVVDDRYNEQDPGQVASEVAAAGAALASTFAALDDAGWQRTGTYNYPTPQLRTVEWIGIHTVHELLHHRVDLG